MAIHLLRDYFTRNITTSNHSYIFSYVLSIFLRRVLSYTHIGSTNFPINSVGSLLIATGDTNPAGAASFPVGNKAGINLGYQKEFYVSIPISVRTVSGNDIGRILTLKSTNYPRFNSGLFVILGVDTATNSYIVDYRTLGDKPPVEAADSIMWWLYEKDLNAPVPGAVNSKTTAEYRGDGDSTTPRIILQSPHALGWQVRICNETTTSQSSNCPQMTVSPGFGGNSAGDFATYGPHFHAPMWYNSSSGIYSGGAPGMGSYTTGVQNRITICGDDTGQGVVFYARRQFNATNPNSAIVCFGLAENEPSPLPVNNQARLFVLGSGYTGVRSNDGGLNPSIIDYDNLNSNFGPAQGMSAAPFGTPIACCASMWAYLSGGGQGTGPETDTFATDTPFTSTTELVPIDLVHGQLGTWSQTAGQAYPYVPRTMGTIPHLKSGRNDFGDFSPTTDFERSYQHLRRGLYIPWYGPNIIP